MKFKAHLINTKKFRTIFKNSLPVTKISQFREVITIYSENHMKYINALYSQIQRFGRSK
jgi:hypothetical protein